MAHFIMFVIVIAIGFIVGRLSVVFLCILYNIYRIHSKFNKLYKNAKDERTRRDIFIDYSKMDKSIPINVFELALHLEKDINCNDLLSKDMYYFLYEY